MTPYLILSDNEYVTDSGDENEPKENVSALSGNQLLASAVVKMTCLSGRKI